MRKLEPKVKSNLKMVDISGSSAVYKISCWSMASVTHFNSMIHHCIRKTILSGDGLSAYT